MKRTLLVILFALWAIPAAQAQTSRCADCHIANSSDTRLSAFARSHVEAWNNSAHARNSVGCETCHGGDATTFDPLRAHAGLRLSGHPASPVNRVNLPATCGKCHTGPFVSFQRSRHYQLLITADERGPTCSTCHGDVGAMLFTPTTVSRRCDHCHGAGEVRPRPDFGPDAGLLLRAVRSVANDLQHAREVIDMMTDRTARQSLLEQYQQAEAPYLEARDAAHRFVFEPARERLDVARERTRALLLRLAERVTSAR
jgi:hypothetical protein